MSKLTARQAKFLGKEATWQREIPFEPVYWMTKSNLLDIAKSDFSLWQNREISERLTLR